MSSKVFLMSPRLSFGGLALCTLLLLPACVPQSAVTGAPAAAPPADPILRAVSSATVSVPVSVASPAYPGAVIVTLLSDYTSAEGQECRAYSLAGAAAPSQHLACTDGAAWREIPALAPAVNPGVLP